MLELTPETISNSLMLSWAFLLIAFIIQLYFLYLNWKQSKVKDKMDELIAVMKEIRDLLRAGKGKRGKG
ncbi:hypothetical protein HYV82_01205 [Candidatus Woesearchaeota archaeon]|nr:hypothetical protein [Candidatus Woesearchaeota archaeon]